MHVFKTQDREEALEAVKQNGHALLHIKQQTPEICMEAVKQNGYALLYVAQQTPEICMAAVKQDVEAVYLIRSKDHFIHICETLGLEYEIQ